MDASPALKRCTKCQQDKPATLAFFYSSKGPKSSQDGLYARCKTCVQAVMRKRPPVPDGYKRCPGCKQELPQTTEYFYGCKSRPDGVAVYCKICQHTRQLVTYARAKERQNTPPETMTCSRCHQTKPATLQFFTMNPLCRYGLNTVCKTCMNARQGEIHHRNADSMRIKWRGYYRSSRLSYQLRYQTQRMRILAQQHAFFATHPEEVRTWKRRYAHSARGREVGRVKEQRRRAYKRATHGTYTLQEIEQQRRRQHNTCYYCKCKLKKYHIEHVVPLSRHGTNDISNLVLSCPTCNLKKGARLPSEWPQGGRLL